MSSPRSLSATALRLSELDEVEVEISKLVSGGDGFGRFEGIPIFVARTAPGDRVRARLVERRSGFGRAEIIEVLEDGPDRQQPRCSHFASCGGCDLQHIDDRVQVRLKVEAAAETLRRLGGIELPSAVEVVAGDSWAYRARTQLQVAETERGIEVGYFARRSNDLVPIEECPVLVPELQRALPAVADCARETTHRRIDLAAGDDGGFTSAPKVEGLPRGEVSAEVAGFTFAYDAGCFFQGHRQLLGDLIRVVAGPPTDEDVVGVERGPVFDLFAGVGLFSLPLARKYQKVVAVEGDRVAARFAERNAQRNRMDNVEVVGSSVESWVERLPSGAARVVVDPPRVGLSVKVRASLLKKKPRAVTYVSCHPATLARDLAALKIRYRLERITFIDLFPQTGHLETVAELRQIEEEASA